MFIIWFKEISREAISHVGGKGANLGELTKLDLLVPEGFCITASAYKEFIKITEEEIQKIANSIDINNQSDLQMKAQNIRAILLKNIMPKVVSKDIVDAYKKLVGNQEAAVAVRSSATAEDLPGASFAGQHETYLNVVGIESVLGKVRECWASMWTPRAIHYRQKHDFEHKKVAMCVVVQKMIFPSVSGVMFTYNSIESTDREIVIESTYGLGEGLVSGIVTPDIFIIDKQNFEIRSKRISEKKMMIIPKQDGVIKTEVPENKQSAPTLTNEEILKLAEIGLRVERHYKAPQDIEWCNYQNRFYILQSRPVTDVGKVVPVLDKKEFEGIIGEWTKSPLDERVQEPLTPFTWSIAQESIPSFFTALEVFGFRVPEDVEMARLFYGRPYVNKTELEKMFSDLPGVVDDFIMGGQVQIDRKKISLSMLPVFFRALLLVNQVHKDWDSELPGILNDFEALKSFDMKDASSEELLSKLDQIIEIAQSIGATHALSIIFCEALYQILVIFAARYTGDDAYDLCPKLVSGLENKTLETNKRIWELAKCAQASKFLRDEILQGNYASLLISLDAKKEGKVFLGNFEKFLKKYGHRSPKYDLIFPSWRDDPDMVLKLIKTYLESEISSDPQALEKKCIQERIKATEFVLRKLNTHTLDRIFPVKRMIFKRLLQLAQKYMTLRENQQFFIGQGYPIARRVVLELGLRFVKMEIIENPLDIFFMNIQEIREIVSGKRVEDVNGKVIKRKGEFQRFKNLETPLIITKDGPKDPTGKEILKGIGGSPGTVHGKARIVTDIKEFGKFKEGEILIAPTTNPSWTPLFIMAKGVVTEVGGMLCHGAVVAREYGIPAVLGVKNATRILRDGQEITIDGGKGIIYTKD